MRTPEHGPQSAFSSKDNVTDDDPIQNTLAPLPPVVPGRYRHYKGGEYELLAVVRHSETLEPLVLYRALYGEQGLWVRPYAMFFESIEVAGERRPRFAPVP